ncbi:hypothetical protein MMC10_000481 [Thelotrema lepadinum]|nr:hypothetical protein [Thelotrema lepadinum]
MVRQAYGYRLALGRSAFELPIWAGNRQPDASNLGNDGIADGESETQIYNQRFNARGHPLNEESRSLVRRNVRAHNEVLSTVDVCARVDSEGKDVGKRQSDSKAVSERNQNPAIIQENETGLWLGVLDDLACLVATTFTANTFSYYEGLSLLRIARVEFSCFGFWKFFFAGEFANTAFYILTTTADAFIEIARDYVVDRLIDRDRPEEGSRRLRLTIDIIEQALKFTSFALLSPLQLFATLQRLDLLPAWPLLPNPFRVSCLSPLLTPLPSQWNRRTSGVFAASFVTSPFITFLCMFYFTDKVKGRLCSYARASIPRPDNPDQDSFKLGIDDGSTGAAPVLDYPKFQGSFHQEIQKDVQYVLDGLTSIRYRMRSHFRWLFDRRRPSVSFPPVRLQDVPPSTYAQDHRGPPSSELLPSQGTYDRPNLPPSLPPIVPAESSTVTSTSPLLTPTSSEDPDISSSEPSNVRIRTRTGSTSTLHMDVEFSPPNRGGPVLTSSFAASPRPAILETIICNATHSKSEPTPYPKAIKETSTELDSLKDLTIE